MWPAPRASPSAAHTAQVLARRVAELESLQTQQQQEYLETTRSVEQLRESMRELSQYQPDADDDYSPWDADERRAVRELDRDDSDDDDSDDDFDEFEDDEDEDSDEDDSDDDDEMAPWHPSDLDGRYSYDDDDDSEEDDTNPNLAAFFPGEEPPREPPRAFPPLATDGSTFKTHYDDAVRGGWQPPDEHTELRERLADLVRVQQRADAACAYAEATLAPAPPRDDYYDDAPPRFLYAPRHEAAPEQRLSTMDALQLVSDSPRASTDLRHLAAVLQQHHAAIQVLARHVETLEEEASWRALQ